jgi:glutamate-1-semialdehyde 2,1-aminomutase
MRDRKERIEGLKQLIREQIPKTGELYSRAVEVYPHGQVSAVRGFDPWAFYAVKGDGAYIWDIDDNKYIDCCMCYGVLLLGHRPQPIIEALHTQLERATHYGSPHPEEVIFGEKFVKCVPGADRVLLCNSGTEATMQSVRIMRAYTGKAKIAKFEGCYHGWHDYATWSVNIGEGEMGPAERPIPAASTAGLPKFVEENMLILPFDESAFDLIEEHASELAGVMIEPVVGGGTFPVDKDFLQKLRQVTEQADVLLMYDEVITGFRLGLGGAQEYFGVLPDLAAFGKSVGGGMPIGAVGVRREILEKTLELDPPLSIAGTFSGNAMTLAAGNAFLDYVMNNPQIYSELAEKGDLLRESFNDYALAKQYPATMTSIGSMWQVHIAPPPMEKPRDQLKTDQNALIEFTLRLRLEGVFVPDMLHLVFTSTAHTDNNIEEILRALKASLDGTFE